jgi:hypothetical protein
MSRIHRCGLALLTALAGTACSRQTDTSWHQENGYRWRALVVPRGKGVGFSKLAAKSTGLTHANVVVDEHAMANRTLLIGAGVAVGDIDEDGLPDVFLASVERPAALYHNDGGFHFRDVTAASGVDTRSLSTSGAVFADVNGDGHVDLIAGTLGGAIKLWLGDGKGHFADSTTTSGISGGYAATTITLADVTGRGPLDMYVSTYKVHNALDKYPPQARAYDQVVKKIGDKYVVVDEWKSEYRLEDRPELGGLMRSQRADPDLFFSNDGRGHFTRTPISGARFTDEWGKPIAAEPDYFGLAARFYDVNGDGAPDLYVCNDFEDPDQIWINDGRGNFRLTPTLSVRETSNTCMSVDFADVNRDGHIDFFTADMMSPTLAARQRQFPTNTALPKQPGLSLDRQQWMRNTLQLARGDGTWASIGEFAGVSASDWTWGSAFLDVDLDGYEDLLTVSGHRWDIRDADTFERIRNSFPRVSWNREQGEFPRLATRNIAFRNNGDLTFRDASASWRFDVDAAISQGIALGDLDGDGDLDVVVTRLDDAPAVYRNEAAMPRVAVRLKGRGPNTQGIGAKVTVRSPSLPVQTREVTAGGYYLSGSDPQLTFAARADSEMTIEVAWRSGRKSTITSVRGNRLYEIDEGGGVDVPAADAADSTAGLFEDATALLAGHRHVDSTFDDYRRQPLLPNRFSQLGPGVSWIDVDGDGREDLLIGAGRGGQLAVLRNSGARFEPISVPGAPARFDLTTIVPVPDAGGGLTLLAGQSNYETSSPAEALSLPSVVGFSVRAGRVQSSAAAALPDTASVGPLALADVNGDGTLDLFVGARAIPGAWPLPAPSRLYLRAKGGAWVRDTVNARTLASLGLVSAALFTDLDGDGRPELVTTAEWGPVRVFHNEGGRFRDVTRELGIATRSSRWNGLAAGDFDGDGRIDLVVTSWGRNTPWQASPDRPYELLVGNFGGDGLGLIFARRDSITGKEMPLESFARLGIAIPSVRERIATFADYSTSPIEKVLGDAARSAVRVGATTFDHLVLLNRGTGFEVRSLPPVAQLAPAFAPVVADFDGDGHEDIFLAQNFSQTNIETPRLDAGTGLILLGDGKGGFRALSVLQSGIHVYGDQRGAAVADYDNDGRVDIAAPQNGAASTLWHNRGGKVGLRVRLKGDAANPLGIGAQVQLVGAAIGPKRELHAGSAYWSMDAATTVLARIQGADMLLVRWPGGVEQRVPIPAGQSEVIVTKIQEGQSR